MDGRRGYLTVGRIEERILEIRGERVIIDADLARFYGVPTKRLNEQVRRNRDRFPEDFMFRLSQAEKQQLVANCDQFSNLKHSKSLPWAFTEHGAIMAANVLNAPRAIAMGVYIVRAFINLRRSAVTHQELAARLDDLEMRLVGHDKQLVSIIEAIRSFLSVKDVPKKRRIGFNTKDA